MTAFQCHWRPSHAQRQMLPHVVIIRAGKLVIRGRTMVFPSWLKAYFNLKSTRRELSSSFLLHFHFPSRACRTPCSSSTPPVFPGLSDLPCSRRTTSISSYTSLPGSLLHWLFMQNNLPSFISNPASSPTITPSLPSLSPQVSTSKVAPLSLFYSQCLVQNNTRPRNWLGQISFSEQ